MDIEVRGFGMSTILLGLWTIALWFMVGVILIGMIEKPSEIDSLLFLWLTMITVGILLGNHVLWSILGKVKLTIDCDKVVIRNINNVFKQETRIPIANFIRVEVRKEQTLAPMWFWGFGKGDVLVKFKNGQRRLGKGWNEKDSLALVKKIDDVIKNYAKHALATSRPRSGDKSRLSDEDFVHD